MGALLEVGEDPKRDVLVSVCDKDFGVRGKTIAWKHVYQAIAGEAPERPKGVSG